MKYSPRKTEAVMYGMPREPGTICWRRGAGAQVRPPGAGVAAAESTGAIEYFLLQEREGWLGGHTGAAVDGTIIGIGTGDDHVNFVALPSRI